MRWKRKRGLRIGVIAAAVVLSASTAYAYTAGNTFSAPARAGDGSRAISGYTVSGITYTIATAAASPASLTSVAFSVGGASPLPSQVKIKLSPGGWFSCTYNSGTGVATCSTPTNPSLSAATSLDVVAVQ